MLQILSRLHSEHYGDLPKLTTTKELEFLAVCAPSNLGRSYHALWMEAAAGNSHVVTEVLARTEVDVGEPLCLFREKSLVYNHCALTELAVRSKMPLPYLLLFVCLRRRAYEVLLDLCQSFLDTHNLFPTNHRSVRLAVACRANRLRAVKALLSAHCSPDALHGLAFFESVRWGRKDILRVLLQHTQCNVGISYPELLIAAAIQSDDETFEMVLYHPDFVSLDDTGAAAIIAALDEKRYLRALVIVADKRWDGVGLHEILERLLKLDESCLDALPVMAEILRKFKNRVNSCNAEAKRNRLMKEALSKLSQRLLQDPEDDPQTNLTAGAAAARKKLSLECPGVSDKPSRSCGIPEQ